MERYKKADMNIASGYDLLTHNEVEKACDTMIEAWEGIKEIMAEDEITDLWELEEKYKWSQFLFNYVQDLEDLLHNASIENPQYYVKRIKYCQELLPVCGDNTDLIIENTRRAIAESYHALGDEKECDRLFESWLTTDPNWGYGYIGWSDCYYFGEPPNHKKADEILSRALEQTNLTDRVDVVDRAIDLYTVMEKMQQADELKREYLELTKPIAMTVVKKDPKIGRNDPCPCGSGKKYKKCCGS